MRPWERKLALTFAAFAAGVILSTCWHNARAEEIATKESKAPWTIAQCDRLAGMPAIAVYNTARWNAGGWPLWAVVCLYPAVR